MLAVGPGLDWWAQAGVEMPVQPGDHIVFPAAAGVWVEIDEERLLVCRVTQLLGVLESASISSSSRRPQRPSASCLPLPLSRSMRSSAARIRVS